MEIKGIVRELPRIQIREIEPPKWLQPNAPTENAPYADFGAMVREVIGQVNDAQQHAADLAATLRPRRACGRADAGAGDGARQPRLPTDPAGAQQGAGRLSATSMRQGLISETPSLSYAGGTEPARGSPREAGGTLSIPIAEPEFTNSCACIPPLPA
jgi:hypothetical protein